MKYYFINGLKVYAPSTREELIREAVRTKKVLIAINATKIAKSDDEFQRLVNNNIGYPDGMGAVWALRQKGASHAVKIPGCELWLDLIRTHVNDSDFYLVGGSQQVVDATVAKLRDTYHGIKIKGWRNGFFNHHDEKSKLVHDIVGAKPRFVFIAMGSPRQEQLIANLFEAHPAIYLGLGGSFDLFVGKTKRAPKLLNGLALEWLYRLVLEPHRIGRQLPLVSFAIRFFRRQL